mmetsp:Transcript_15070/g.18635  ORF Transcript_15070/g.18635 Transcript_15070/m.18635 type:complete len:100 (-) Transcript_15070:257-556(-)
MNLRYRSTQLNIIFPNMLKFREKIVVIKTKIMKSVAVGMQVEATENLRPSAKDANITAEEVMTTPMVALERISVEVIIGEHKINKSKSTNPEQTFLSTL